MSRTSEGKSSENLCERQNNHYEVDEVGRVKIEFLIGLVTNLKRDLEDYSRHLSEMKNWQRPFSFSQDKFYHEHKLLKKSPYFCSVRKLLIQGGFHSEAAIISRFNEMQECIDLLKEILNKETCCKAIDVCNEKSFLLEFNEILPAFICQVFVRKLLSEIWIYIRDNIDSKLSIENGLVFMNLKLFLYGLHLPSIKPDDYPLHKAVIDDDFYSLHKFINYRTEFNKVYVGINEADPLGNTPLSLAVKLGRTSMVTFLVEKGASIKLNPHEFKRNAREEAILAKNKEILKILLLASIEEDQEILTSQHKTIDNLLSTIPDFSCKFKWEVDSKIIPFVKRWAPSDTYFIYKKGN